MDDTRLKNFDINVSTTNGVVTKGSAPDAKASRATENMTMHAEGIISKGVKSIDPTNIKIIKE